MNYSLSDPEAMAKRGEELYREKYKEKYELEHADEFVAIDVTTGEAYLGQEPAEAFEKAREESPNGLFHLIQIGHAGAFRVSYTAPKPNAGPSVFGRVVR